MLLASTVTQSVSDLLGVGTSALEWILSNSILAIIFAGCLIPVAFRVIRSAKKAAK